MTISGKKPHHCVVICNLFELKSDSETEMSQRSGKFLKATKKSCEFN